IVGVIGVPEWSADGKYIAFDRFYSWGLDNREAGYQPLEVYVLDVNTFTPCLLSTNWYANDQNANWLPESSQQ
ncbi:MAG TPA: hypothetical protein VHD90_12485, partial [Phototrophicaceae bacterium]|nr:hypothetical protein [Phototrophicaceae bacterium]